MNHFGFDASALAKRYSLETGADRVDYLFDHVTRDRLVCLMLGVAEVISVLVRKKNAGVLSLATFLQSKSNIKAEILDDDDFDTLPVDHDVITDALPLIEKHSRNATDAIVLRVFLDVAASLRNSGDDLVAVAADHRLLSAATAEGLTTLNPETEALAVVRTLTGA